MNFFKIKSLVTFTMAVKIIVCVKLITQHAS